MTDLAHLFGDFLSLICISSCLWCKVPQIQTIRRLKSAEGLSVNALTLEVLSYTVTLLYNWTNHYPLLNYLEYPILVAQEYVLVYYVYFYKDLLNKRTWIYVGIYATIVLGYGFDLLWKGALIYLIPFTTPVSVFSKVIQLIEILRTKDSESISCTTWAISAFTNGARIYTILLDTGDRMLLANFSISTLLALLVLAAAWFYKRPKSKTE